MSITKYVLLNWYSSMKKEIEKDSDDFWRRKLTLKVEFWHFLTPPHYTNSQNSIISFGYVDFKAKIFPILYPPLENSTTRITITYIKDFENHRGYDFLNFSHSWLDLGNFPVPLLNIVNILCMYLFSLPKWLSKFINFQ